MAKNRIKQHVCPNCGYEFDETDNFCPNCGQENHTHKLPVRHFVMEYLESAFHFDTKMFVTLRDLLIYPGRITVNYNQNKRARYVPPMRLYIFISFIFFFLLAVLPGNVHDDARSSKIEQKIGKEPPSQMGVTFNMDDDDSDDVVDRNVSLRNNPVAQVLFDSICKTPNPNNELIDKYFVASKTTINWYNHNFKRNLLKIRTGHATVEEWMHKVQKTVSTLMFFMMPLFALFLWLLFWRRKLYYTEHLVFSIHIHCIVFLVLILYALVSSLFSVSLWWPFFVTFIYGWLCARNVYGIGWLKTTGKVLMAGFFYAVSLLIMLVIGVVISLF